MRIAIIGGGVTGCAFYLWLERLGLTGEHDVSIYEARRPSDVFNSGVYSSSAIGATIGIAPNGLKVLHGLSSELYEEVLRNGSPISQWKLLTARGWVLANVPTDSRGRDGLMIGRHVFWKCLRARVPDHVVRYSKVVGLQIRHPVTTLIFDDARKIDADLVVGADGIWSVVRRDMFHDAYPPHYEGLVGVGGLLPRSYLVDVPHGEMNVVFGGNGFFGYGYHSDLDDEDLPSCWWSTHSMPECPQDWKKIDIDNVQNQLQQRHASWRNPTVQNIIRDVKVDAVWPTFTTPLLPSWTQGNCVVIGDAAHALQPSSGQGVSQALEDAECLARLIEQRSSKEDVVLVLKWLCTLRMPRLKSVHDAALQTSAVKHDMSIFAEILMYIIIWVINKFGIDEKHRRCIHDYDVAHAVDQATAASKQS